MSVKAFLPPIPSVKVSECSGCISTFDSALIEETQTPSELRLRQGFFQAREDFWPKVFWPNLG